MFDLISILNAMWGRSTFHFFSFFFMERESARVSNLLAVKVFQKNVVFIYE